MNITDVKNETAVLGGGCFWCTEAMFSRIEGVHEVIPGYAGGSVENPTYQDVCSGETGHAEVIKIVFDPVYISYFRLLELFFLSHDPTSLNRQGADIGTQYRSVVFFTSEEQKKIAADYIEKLNGGGAFTQPVVTSVEELTAFYPAENYHRNYYNQNKNQPYCSYVIRPKLEKFRLLLLDKK